MKTRNGSRAGAGFLLCILPAALLFVVFEGCSRDESMMAPELTSKGIYSNSIDPELAAGEVVLASGWEYDPDVELPLKLDLLVDKAARCRIVDCEREPLVGDIVRYSYTLHVGPGAHEKIRLHRVVKETEPYLPIRTRESVFALHGVPGNFNQWFLVGAVAPSAPPDHGLAIYLAENDIDVWGIDQAYYLVPPETTDFSFMADWGMQFDIDNLRTGMAIARCTRLFTGSGFDRMTLIGLGHGGGGMTGYAALNHETQLPRFLRHIGAFIPISCSFKTDNAAWQTYFCASAQNFADMLEAGIYEDAQGQMFSTMAYLALVDPEGDSPFVPGFTNRGAILFIAAMTWVPLQYPDESHYYAAILGEDGFPADLRYTTVEVALEGTQQIDPCASARYRYEVEAIKCDGIDLPFDDHLGEITVPILAVGTGGYFGNLIEYTTTLLGSNDVTILNVSLEEEMMYDIGVVDISHARKAPTLFWQPMLDWIEDHTCPDTVADTEQLAASR